MREREEKPKRYECTACKNPHPITRFAFREYGGVCGPQHVARLKKGSDDANE